MVGDRSTLRRRPHIRRPPGSPDSPNARLRVRGPRRCSAPANMPSSDPGAPSTSRTHDELYRASLASSSPVQRPRPKPFLHPIVTSDLTAVPKMRTGVHITPAPEKTSKPKSTRKKPPSAWHHSDRPSHARKQDAPTHSNPVMQTNHHSSRPLPIVPANINSTVVTVAHPPASAPRAVSGSTFSRNPTKQSTGGTEISSYFSPATIWSQRSASPSGIPPSRHTSLFIAFSESQPPKTVPRADVQRKTTLEKLIADWSHIDDVLQETVVNRASVAVESGPQSRFSGNGSNDDVTIPRAGDDNLSSSSSSTPTTVGPPTPTHEANKHTTDAAAKHVHAAVPFSSVVPRKSRYDGPWGRAAAPSDSGNGSTVGDLLMERWARAYATAPTSATPDQSPSSQTGGVALQ